MRKAASRHSVRKPTEADRFTGRKVRQARRERGMSQDALAEALGLTFQQVQKYESGRSRLSAGRLRDVAIALAKPVTFFFEPLSLPQPDSGERCQRVQLLRHDARRLIDRLSDPEDLTAAIHVLTALGMRRS